MVRALMLAVAFLSTSVAYASTMAPDAQADAVGRCLAGRDRPAAERLLKSLPLGDVPVRIDTDMLGGSACAKGVPVEASALVLRGGIAEGLYRHDFDGFGMAPRRNAAMLAQMGMPPLGRADDALPSSAVRLARFADCVVRNDTSDTETLMGSPYGSAMEGKLLGKLMPYVAACQPKRGEELKVGRGTLRALLALAAYDVSSRLASGKLSAPGIF